jgi:hypothetical protein
MENPLQAVLAEPFPLLVNGSFALTDAPGLGVAPTLLEAKSFLAHRIELRK